MALIKKWEIRLYVEYDTWTDIECETEEEAVKLATEEFYSESHRASIENWEASFTLYCDECDVENVDDDLECQEDSE